MRGDGDVAGTGSSGVPCAIEALASSGQRRSGDFEPGHLSDEDLIQAVVEREIDPTRMELLVAVSSVLRLMDGLVSGSEMGEGFVAKFSERWLSLPDRRSDPLLEATLDELDDFYEEIQMFSAKPEHRQEEPLLFGLEHLRELTGDAYGRLKDVWCQSLLGSGK